MKKGIIFWGLLTMSLVVSACGNKSQKVVVEDNGSEFVPRKGDLKVTLDIGTDNIDSVENVLQCRLEKADLCPYLLERTDDAITVYARLDNDKDQPQLLRLLTANGDIEFWATYHASDISPKLLAVQEAYATGYAKPLIGQTYNNMGAVAAMAHVRDTAFVNKMLRSDQAKKTLPGDLRLLWSANPITMDNGDDILELFAIRTNFREAPINARNITSAEADIDEYSSQPIVNLTMDDEGARIFATLTRENIGSAIAIVMNNTVYTAPIVNSEIIGGNCTISSHFTIEETRFLADILNSGRLPKGIRIRSCEKAS